ncbi:putative bifunctional diguanylate cyclase/phosphodiesterase [Paenibacillus alba]|uniref:GGDEF domain-containing phosphodiesterase n=1 Tax=Paenibacillus alba TaxID=1197127 RepID=A0ABU6G543_9BACL|nr:GGDEF domain-containing phosphodiesterase [Paenibacillus alba]MEC0229080.1 GGDEF domain-containing phosphodiesterase [Paenibacillus alba]
MSMSETFDHIETLIVILILTSLAMYVFFAFYEIKYEQHKEQKNFIDNIIAFSMLWIIECIVIVLSFLYYNQAERSNALLEIMMIAATVAFIVVWGALDLFHKKRIQFRPLFTASTILTLAVIFCYWFQLSFHTLLNLSSGLLSIMSLLFGIAAFQKNKYVARVGLLYLFSGSIIIIVINNAHVRLSFHLMLTLDLAFSMLLMIGFFIHYCELYSISILDHIRNIQQKNERLSEAEQRIKQLAYSDPITKLKNVYQLQEDLPLFNSRRLASPSQQIQFILINVHNFKNFSNWVGYKKGNTTLFEIAFRLQNLCKDKDEIFRFNYDQFILVHFGDRETCQQLISNIQDMFRDSLFYGRNFEAYLGATEGSTSPKTLDMLIKEMELASQTAFIEKKFFCYYCDEMFQVLVQQLSMEQDLRTASEVHAWEVVYQPKLSLGNDRIVGAEALLRWNRHGTYISPEVFIPMAEQMGLIQEIGYHVIRTAFSFLKQIQLTESRSLVISINLSPSQLMEPDFVDNVLKITRHYDIHPSSITFEITESTFISHIERVNETIQLLKDQGFSFSLDDFGVGYSSIHYFSRLNVDEVKLDKTFTESLTYDMKNRIILHSIVTMAKTLGIAIVIEGVEQKEQLDIIKELKCDFYQGYYFSKPVPPGEMLQLLSLQYQTSLSQS